ncbi:cell adhesion molecule 3, partial [Spinachia spinachia]
RRSLQHETLLLTPPPSSLGVPGKPQISGFENAVPEGVKVVLTCSSTGSRPPASLHWYRGDQELEGRPKVAESFPDDPTYNVSSELTLEVSRGDDNTLITCAVKHPSLPDGDKRSEQALRVLYSPYVQIVPESDLPREGEKFYLKCSGNANPEPTSYIWEKKDGELPPAAKVEGAFLHFERLNKSDNGVYLCLADNGIGSNQGEYTLLVQDSADTTLSFLDPATSPSSSTSSLPSSTSSSVPTSSSPPDLSSTSTSSSPPDLSSTSTSSSPPDLSSTSTSSSPPDLSSTSTSSSPPDLSSTSTSSSPPDLSSTSTSSSPPDLSSTSTSSSPPDLSSTSTSSSPPDLSSTSTSSPLPDPSSPFPSPDPADALLTTTSLFSTTALSNALFPNMPLSPSSSSSSSSPAPPSSATISPSPASSSRPSPAISLTPSVSVELNGVYTVAEDAADNSADPTAMATSSGVDHAVIGGVVAVIVFILLCLLIVLGRYLIRHKGTYLTHEAKGSDDAPDADTAIINAEGGHSGAEDKKEYFI